MSTSMKIQVPQKTEVLCLMTILRGGSKLFHSLIDGHPQVICLPRTFQYSHFWKSISANSDAESIALHFYNSYPRFFSGKEWYRFNKYDKADELGVNRNETFLINKDFFISHFVSLSSQSSLSRKDVFLNLHYAHHLASERTFLQHMIILYHIHDTYFFSEIDICLEDFQDDVKLAITIRHPLQGIDSCYNWMIMHNSFGGNQMYSYQKQIIECGSILEKKYPHLNKVIIPLEMVKSHSRVLMEKFAHWLNISWSDNLLESTIQGKIWYGNAKKAIKGTENQLKTFRPRSLFERKDFYILNYYFHHRLKNQRYIPADSPKPSQSFFPSILIFLPTHIELMVFFRSVSIFHWIDSIKMSIENSRNDRLKGFDYLTKQTIRDGSSWSSYFQLGLSIFRNIKMGNLMTAFIFYVKRVFYYKSFINFYSENNEPKMILEVEINANLN